MGREIFKNHELQKKKKTQLVLAQFTVSHKIPKFVPTRSYLGHFYTYQSSLCQCLQRT